MKRITAGAATLLAFVLPAACWARPITYPGGTSVMLMTDPTMSMAGADYTLTPQWAVGAAVTHDRDDDTTTIGPNLTRGWRWNQPDSQANVYASGGIGAGILDRDTRPAGWAGISADWEDRRWYLQAGTRGQAIDGGPARLRNSARVGVAPYVAETGQLHSWLMLQVDNAPGTNRTWSVTPLLRQFWGTYLWEAGINNRGGVMFNVTAAF